MNGFPQMIEKFLSYLHGFWNFRDELSIENGIILKSHKIPIPSSMQHKILELIHKGHLGMEKCINHARNHVHWIGISNDIRQIVDKCAMYQKTGTSNWKLLPTVSEVPPFPWHTLGTDLFYWRHQDFLVVADYLSNFLIIRRLPSFTAQAVIKELSMIITEYGQPVIIRSDNRLCYASKEIKQLMELFQIDHITSSPHYHQSNRFAESMVKLPKKLMQHSTLDGKPWNYRLLEFKCTPISGTLPSPLEILTNNTANTPQIQQCHEELTKHQGISTNEQETLILEPGQPVWVQDPVSLSWKPATVKEHADEPSSYWIQTMENSILRRTRHLKPRLNPTPFEVSDHLEKFQQFPNLEESQMKFPSQAPALKSASPSFPVIPMKARNTPSFPSSTPSTIAKEPRRSIRIHKGVPSMRFTPS